MMTEAQGLRFGELPQCIERRQPRVELRIVASDQFRHDEIPVLKDPQRRRSAERLRARGWKGSVASRAFTRKGPRVDGAVARCGCEAAWRYRARGMSAMCFGW